MIPMSSHRPATPPRLARALAGAGCALALLLGIMAVASQSEPLAASRLAELRERVFLPRIHRAPASAQADSLVVADVIGGPLRAAAWHGNFLYRGDAGRVRVYDCSDLGSPVEVGRSEVLPGLVHDLKVSGSYLLAAMGEGGLAVFDIGAPAAPALRHRIATSDSAHALDASEEGLVAVAAGPSGLLLLGLSPDGRLEGRGALTFPSEVSRVRLHRGYAYLSFRELRPIKVVDVRQPEEPVPVADLRDFEGGDSMASNVVIEGDRAYVWSCSPCTILVYDIREPASPRFTDYRKTGDSGTLTIADGRLYAAGDRLRIFDISTRDGLTLIGDVDLPEIIPGFADSSQYPHELAAEAGRVAIVASPYGEDWDPGDLYEGGSLLLVDARDPLQPRVTSRVGPVDVLTDLWPSGAPDRLYGRSSVRNAGAWHSTARLLEAADPRHLRLGEAIPALDYVNDMVVDGKVAYAVQVDQFDRLEQALFATFDVADPAAPRKLGSVALGQGWQWRSPVAVSNGMAYVVGHASNESGWDNSLLALDVRDPSEPRVLSRQSIQLAIAEIDVAGARLWAGGFDGQEQGYVLRYDLADPTQPKLQARIPVTGALEGGIVADEEGAWLATWNGLVRVPAHASDGTAVKVAAPGSFTSLEVNGQGQLVAAGEYLAVFDVQASQVTLRATIEAPYQSNRSLGFLEAMPVVDHFVALFWAEGGVAHVMPITALVLDPLAP